MKKNDGGSAFPQIETNQVGERGEYWTDVSSTGGMSLRDYFAAKAMQGLLANPGDWNAETHAERAAFAYAQADAMIAACHAG